MFNGADDNGDGYVNLNEHLTFFLHLPGEPLMSPLQLVSMFREADKDTDYRVTLDGKDIYFLIRS